MSINRAIVEAGLILVGLSTSALAEVPATVPISTFGTPGLIDMPTGEMLSDGALISSISRHDGSQRYNLTFQLTPRLYGTFRYAIIDSFDGNGSARYDRSFDVGYLLTEESLNWPSIVIGLRDFGGTGAYASEFIAGTKHFLDHRLAVTGGIGWGRLGSYGGFQNPLSVFSNRLKSRSENALSHGQDTGQLDFDQWFRGDAALFGGLSYKITPNLTLKAEYSSDAYEVEGANAGFTHQTPFNFGLTYSSRYANLSAYLLHGSEIGISASFITDPKRAAIPGGIEAAPPAIVPSAFRRAQGWEGHSTDQGKARLTQALRDQGLILEAVSLSGSEATLRLINTRYRAASQALGRAARVAANTLPSSITTFHIELVRHGMALSRSSLRRQDLEALEYDLDGAWKSFARTTISEADSKAIPPVTETYPLFDWSLTPYLEPELFDPDNPVRADLGLQAFASFEPVRGLVFSGALRQRAFGNLNTSTRPSNSQLPHVRTDITEYAKQSDLQIKHLTGEYFFRPGPDLYGRLSAGYFETMYGGLSGEVLWKPVEGPLALGAEINYARQRNFDQLFGFQRRDVVTGHVSAYYDFGGGYLGQLDAGRYLAGDWGATVSFDREFNNGFRVGAFFTLTDVPFDTFGEGSFDKGIRFDIPITWLVGAPARSGFSTTIRPVQRDGGARLEVRNRLYDLIRDSHVTELEDGWGRFWR
ncbi:YjbH domain-containing protein [Aliiroseovarius crassostreae]|uniref:YjbH domain-containing protein n=1 Tax=Aliiroseovarius crassostreae TaxID=154981 RepID=UPI00223C49A9|nr:YjbH domain-containing protein [Aliiroseovarius crassostreae]